MLQNLDEMQFATEAFYRTTDFSKSSFKNTAYATANIELPNVVIDTIFAVFDLDDSGTLQKEEFLDVMKKIKTRGLKNSRDLGFWRFVNCCTNCFKF